MKDAAVWAAVLAFMFYNAWSFNLSLLLPRDPGIQLFKQHRLSLVMCSICWPEQRHHPKGVTELLCVIVHRAQSAGLNNGAGLSVSLLGNVCFILTKQNYSDLCKKVVGIYQFKKKNSTRMHTLFFFFAC